MWTETISKVVASQQTMKALIQGGKNPMHSNEVFCSGITTEAVRVGENTKYWKSSEKTTSTYLRMKCNIVK